MQQLKVKAKCVVDAEGRKKHIASALGRLKTKDKDGMMEFGPSPDHEKEVVIVGSGPSVKGQLPKIRKLVKAGAMVMAIKGAHDFLIGKKIIPHVAVAVDPQPHIVRCFRKKLPKGEPNRPAYLIASQCCPEVFDYLSDQNVILWHLMASSSAQVLSGRLQIGGGSTSGSRGIVIAWMMGFRTFHLFGFDSCLQDNGQKGNKRLRKITGETWGEGKQTTLTLVCEGKEYFADPAMAAQASEIQNVVKMLTGSRFKAHGKGLLQAIFAANAAKNWGGYYAVSDEFGEGRIPAVRKKDADDIKYLVEAAGVGVYRGRNYFSECGNKAA